MAAAHAAGIAAIYLSTNPAAKPSQVSDALVANATPGPVVNPGDGSPNRILYSLIPTTTPIEGRSYNAVTEYSPTQNQSGPWSYGYQTSLIQL